MPPNAKLLLSVNVSSLQPSDGIPERLLYQPLTSPHYPRAPITEAVIQLRMTADVEMKALAKIQHRLKSAYPNSQQLQNVAFSFDNTGRQINVVQNPQGFRLANDDQTDIVMLTPRDLTAARLPPYPGWEHLRANANTAWKIWKAATPRHPIERIGVRFINRIDIPVADAHLFDIQEYLNFYPSTSPITAAPMLGYLLQVTVPTFDPLSIATITTTTLGTNLIPKHHSLILDIDVSRTADIPIRDDRLWPLIDQARVIKNDIFERCITDASRKLFAS